MLRGRVAKSYASHYLTNTQATNAYGGLVEENGQPAITIFFFEGNPNLQPISQGLLELGYRLKLSNRLSIDTEIFRSRLENSSYIISEGLTLRQLEGLAIIGVNSRYLNIPAIAIQTGFTASASYYGDKFSLKPYITWQQTNIQDFSPYDQTPELFESTGGAFGEGHYLVTEDVSHLATPSWYGGINMIFKPHRKLDIGVNGYFMSNQIYGDYLGNRHEVGGKVIGSCRVAYRVNSQAALSFSVRDITNSDIAEYYFTDPIKTSYWFGLNLNLR